MQTKGLWTDYVSEIDRLFHAPDRPTEKPSAARELEKSRAKRIARLRDVPCTQDASSSLPSLWEEF